jgi:hypothetical protein
MAALLDTRLHPLQADPILDPRYEAATAITTMLLTCLFALIKFMSVWLLSLGNLRLSSYKPHQFEVSADGRYFPFDLKHMTIDASPDMDYMELAENIKFLVLPPPVAVDNMTVNHMGAPGLATPHDLEGASDSKSDPEGAPGRAARVILARRNAPDNRVWANVEELASELVTGYGLQVEVVSFGAISFEEQVPFSS